MFISFIYIKRIHIFLCILFMISCSKSENDLILESDYSIRLDENIHSLIDDLSNIGQINLIERINNKEYLISDNNQISIINNYEQVGIIGVKGEGPCEYLNITSLSAIDNKLYVLDRAQAKIIIYDLYNYDCIKEFSNDIFSSMTSIVTDGGKLFLSSSNYNAAYDKSHDLLYEYNESNNNIEPLGITVGDLNANLLLSSLRVSNPMILHDNALFIYLPLAGNLFIFSDELISKFNLIIERPDKNEVDTHDGIEVMNLINNKIEIIFDIIPLKDQLVLISKIGTDDNTNWLIKFYDYSGNYRGKIVDKTRILNVNENYYTRLTISLEDEHRKNPYIIEKVYYEPY